MSAAVIDSIALTETVDIDSVMRMPREFFEIPLKESLMKELMERLHGRMFEYPAIPELFAHQLAMKIRKRFGKRVVWVVSSSPHTIAHHVAKVLSVKFGCVRQLLLLEGYQSSWFSHFAHIESGELVIQVDDYAADKTVLDTREIIRNVHGLRNQPNFAPVVACIVNRFPDHVIHDGEDGLEVISLIDVSL